MQHFLLSPAARDLPVSRVARMGEEEAYDTFCRIRWAVTDGVPVYPRCNCRKSYSISTRRKFKCRSCHRQFSVTSGSIFASRKLAFRDYLLAIAIFVSGAKGTSALRLSQELGVQYKTAFVLAHKLREAMADAQAAISALVGEVEVDGAYFGGYVRPESRRLDRKDRRKKVNQTGKRRVVVVARERHGSTVVEVRHREIDAVEALSQRIAAGSTVYATRRQDGMTSKSTSTLGGSTMPKPTRRTAHPRIGQNRSSPVCAAPRSGSTITYRIATCPRMRAKWLGERTSGGLGRGRRRWVFSASRWRTASVVSGKATGNTPLQKTNNKRCGG